MNGKEKLADFIMTVVKLTALFTVLYVLAYR